MLLPTNSIEHCFLTTCVVGIWTTNLWWLSCDCNFLGWVFFVSPTAQCPRERHLSFHAGSFWGWGGVGQIYFCLPHFLREHPWQSQLHWRKVFFDFPPWVGSGLCPCALWHFESWITGLPWFCQCPQGKISMFTCLSGFLSLFRFWSKWCSLGSC